MNGHKRKISKTIICFRKQIKHIKSIFEIGGKDGRFN